MSGKKKKNIVAEGGAGGGAEVSEELSEEVKELTIPQLREKLEAYNFRLSKSIRDRNYMQLERDAIARFLQVNKEETSEIIAKLSRIDQDMEEKKSGHDNLLKIYQQRVTSLLHEHQNIEKNIGIDSNNTLSKTDEQHRSRLVRMVEESDKTNNEGNMKQKQHEEEVKVLRHGFSKNIIKLREQFDQLHYELSEKLKNELAVVEKELDLRYRVEVHEIEERKNQHISELQGNHQEAFDQVKEYYKDITIDNVQLIKALKEEILEMKGNEQVNQKRNSQLSLENKNLSEPLVKLQETRNQLVEQLKIHHKNQTALRNLRLRTSQLEIKIKDTRKSCQRQQDRLAKLKKERDGLKDKFVSGIEDINKRANLKGEFLSKKIETLEKSLKSSPSEIEEDESALMEYLEYQLHLSTKMYNDTLRLINAKFTQLGVLSNSEVLPYHYYEDSSISSAPAPNLIVK